jgi:hypothetical protein
VRSAKSVEEAELPPGDDGGCAAPAARPGDGATAAIAAWRLAAALHAGCWLAGGCASSSHSSIIDLLTDQPIRAFWLLAALAGKEPEKCQISAQGQQHEQAAGLRWDSPTESVATGRLAGTLAVKVGA